MERTVPTSGNEDIALYIRTYYSLLRSSREVPIRAVTEAHMRSNSALHVHANEADVDMSAFFYSIMRLPDCFLRHVTLVVMGQSSPVFQQNGYPEIEKWTEVTAPARRRRSFFNGESTLGVYIASRSDIDDLIPMMTAYQIEHDKLHEVLSHTSITDLLIQGVAEELTADMLATIAKRSSLELADLQKLQRVWGDETAANLLHIATVPCTLSVQLLAGSFVNYKRATRRWWEGIAAQCSDIHFSDRPIYFVSSNTHSLANLVSGHTRAVESDLIQFIESQESAELLEILHQQKVDGAPRGRRDNLLYYALKKYESKYPDSEQVRLKTERDLGLFRINNPQFLDLEAQVIEVRNLLSENLDKRISISDREKLAASDALIINIDYPLGMAAYQILSEISRNISQVKGVFIMGKAAILNGRIGDVMIPNVVHDEHSSNTYLFRNYFTADHVAPYLTHAVVLDNQKAITVPGTYLQNHEYMSVFYREGYTDLEMEAGPYLSCVYELVRPRRYPQNEMVNLHVADFPIGILHYASDTPFSKGENLGSRNLSYDGIESTYATTIAIVQAIIDEETRG
ncbi:MAG: hypothetical protein ACI9EW_002227 [Cellvibrionaceae bacterium]|jgi:hypothetical protein